MRQVGRRLERGHFHARADVKLHEELQMLL